MTNEQREQLLFDCLPKGDHREQVLIDAMRYSRGRDDPHLFADTRRPALHGR